MKVSQRVIWTEGMFMSPQHLQQLDRYHEGYVAARMTAVSPYDWGVLGVDLDPHALVAGQVRVQRFEGVLPDGLPLAFDGTHPEAPPARPIEGHFGPTQKVLEVYLAVPAEREGAPAVATATAAATGLRYFTAARGVVDAAGGASDVSVGFALRNVVVMFGDEARDDFESIKIAEIVRQPSGTLEIRQEYIPPARRLAASPWLLANLRQLLATMATKQRNYAGKRRERGDSTVEYGPGDIDIVLWLNALNSSLPVVNHLIERAAEVTPESAYLLLCQFAGTLATLWSDEDPTTLPKFLYTDLERTFGDLFRRINKLLGGKDIERYIIVPLTSREDGLHFGQLDDERLRRGAQYILSVQTAQPERQAADQVPQLSKIASWGDIAAIVQAAVPGVPLQVTWKPPPEIPVKAGLLYFMVVQGNEWWRNVAAEQTIAIYLPPPYDPASIQLQLLAIPKAPAGKP